MICNRGVALPEIHHAIRTFNDWAKRTSFEIKAQFFRTQRSIGNVPLVQFEDKYDSIGFQIYSFSTFDRIKKWYGNANRKSAEKPYFIDIGSTARTVNLFVIASTRFETVC